MAGHVAQPDRRLRRGRECAGKVGRKDERRCAVRRERDFSGRGGEQLCAFRQLDFRLHGQRFGGEVVQQNREFRVRRVFEQITVQRPACRRAVEIILHDHGFRSARKRPVGIRELQQPHRFGSGFEERRDRRRGRDGVEQPLRRTEGGGRGEESPVNPLEAFDFESGRECDRFVSEKNGDRFPAAPEDARQLGAGDSFEVACIAEARQQPDHVEISGQ